MTCHGTTSLMTMMVKMTWKMISRTTGGSWSTEMSSASRLIFHCCLPYLVSSLRAITMPLHLLSIRMCWIYPSRTLRIQDLTEFLEYQVEESPIKLWIKTTVLICWILSEKINTCSLYKLHIPQPRRVCRVCASCRVCAVCVPCVFRAVYQLRKINLRAITERWRLSSCPSLVLTSGKVWFFVHFLIR